MRISSRGLTTLAVLGLGVAAMSLIERHQSLPARRQVEAAASLASHSPEPALALASPAPIASPVAEPPAAAPPREVVLTPIELTTFELELQVRIVEESKSYARPGQPVWHVSKEDADSKIKLAFRAPEHRLDAILAELVSATAATAGSLPTLYADVQRRSQLRPTNRTDQITHFAALGVELYGWTTITVSPLPEGVELVQVTDSAGMDEELARSPWFVPPFISVHTQPDPGLLRWQVISGGYVPRGDASRTPDPSAPKALERYLEEDDR